MSGSNPHGPHREAWTPPRPRPYPPRPAARPSTIRRWDIAPQLRDKPEENG